MAPLDRAIWGARLPQHIHISSASSPSLVLTSLRRAFPRTTVQTLHHRTMGIRSIDTPRPNRFNHHPHLSALTSTSTAALARKEAAQTLPLRTGVLATKKGMMSHYDSTTGKRTPCTVLQLDRCQVVAHKRRNVHGYWAVQIGSGWKSPDNVTRPMLGHFAASQVAPKRFLSEFRVKDENGLIPVGKQMGAGWFKIGNFVDTRSNTRGMGFAGGMKRHGMSGQPASHGQSATHRTMGSAGASQGSGSRVLPGKRMPGRMGGQRHTVQNLKIMHVDDDRGILVVSGPVSGPKGCLVKVQDALKKPWPEVEDEFVEETAEKQAS